MMSIWVESTTRGLRLIGLGLLCLLLTACWSAPTKPVEEEDEEDPPTPAMYLERAKEMLASVEQPNDLTEIRLSKVRKLLQAIPPEAPETREARALLKLIEEREQARFNPMLWDFVKQMDQRRLDLASQLTTNLRKIDGQLEVKASGFGKTELEIKSASLNSEKAAAIKAILDKTGIVKSGGFIRVDIRNQEQILLSEILDQKS